MIFALCLHAHLLQSAFQTLKLFLSPCIHKPDLLFFFIATQFVVHNSRHIVTSTVALTGGGVCVPVHCICSPQCHLTVCHSPFLTPYFILTSSAFAPGDLGRNILENILCTALSCKCLPSSVPFTQLIQHGMLGTT